MDFGISGVEIPLSEIHINGPVGVTSIAEGETHGLFFLFQDPEIGFKRGVHLVAHGGDE